jgi:pimeloyl-ACP methyl ester carboxylesterase
MNRLLPYHNDQTLSYADCGNENGYPLLVQHGLIASIRDEHLFDHLVDAGVRVISIARPGYGESSPYPMANVAEWGEIVSLLVDELHLPQFDVLGMSSGAPYSYAIGYQLPKKARNIYIFSGIPALYDKDVQAVWPFPITPDASLAELETLAKDLFFSNLSPEALMQDDIRDSMHYRCFGIALDFKLRVNPWGFLLSQVNQKVYMQHSRTDNLPPVEITAKLLPSSRLEIRESGEHFSKDLLDDFIKTTVLPGIEENMKQAAAMIK